MLANTALYFTHNKAQLRAQNIAKKSKELTDSFWLYPDCGQPRTQNFVSEESQKCHLHLKTLGISLTCKLVSVQCRECGDGLLYNLN